MCTHTHGTHFQILTSDVMSAKISWLCTLVVTANGMSVIYVTWRQVMFSVRGKREKGAKLLEKKWFLYNERETTAAKGGQSSVFSNSAC